jgi:hypothetical protein
MKSHLQPAADRPRPLDLRVGSKSALPNVVPVHLRRIRNSGHAPGDARQDSDGPIAEIEIAEERAQAREDKNMRGEQHAANLRCDSFYF